VVSLVSTWFFPVSLARTKSSQGTHRFPTCSLPSLLPLASPVADVFCRVRQTQTRFLAAVLGRDLGISGRLPTGFLTNPDRG
jgi:hypothetical protein